jgi:hypothetical protein
MPTNKTTGTAAAANIRTRKSPGNAPRPPTRPEFQSKKIANHSNLPEGDFDLSKNLATTMKGLKLGGNKKKHRKKPSNPRSFLH